MRRKLREDVEAASEIADVLSEHGIGIRRGCKVMLTLIPLGLVARGEDKEKWMKRFSDLWDIHEKLHREEEKSEAKQRRRNLKVVGGDES